MAKRGRKVGWRGPVRREDQISLRLSSTLRAELDSAARAEGSRLSRYIRNLLIDVTARRVTEGMANASINPR
jgi:hypothetical protein